MALIFLSAINIWPLSSSYSRKSKLINDDLPAPDLPTMPTFSPCLICKLKFEKK